MGWKLLFPVLSRCAFAHSDSAALLQVVSGNGPSNGADGRAALNRSPLKVRELGPCTAHITGQYCMNHTAQRYASELPYQDGELVDLAARWCEEAHPELLNEGYMEIDFNGDSFTCCHPGGIYGVDENWNIYDCPPIDNDDDVTGNDNDISSSKGDPHMVNMRGKRFDVYAEGFVNLVKVPREVQTENATMYMVANLKAVTTLRANASHCAPTVIDRFVIGGRAMGGMKLNVAVGTLYPHMSTHGSAGGELAVQWNQAADGAVEVRYSSMTARITQHRSKSGDYVFLNLDVKGLHSLQSEVGGILGMDDWADDIERVDCPAVHLSRAAAQVEGFMVKAS